MADVTIGLLGVGNILDSHLAALKANPEYKLVSICRRSPEKLKAQAAQLGVKGYTDYHDMLDEPPEVLLISLPHSLHHRVTLEAIEAGCHCLVEKPLAVGVAEANEMIHAAETAGRSLVITESCYWDRRFMTARSVVAGGHLDGFLFGNLCNHRFYFTKDRPGWFLRSDTSGGGQFMNVGVHRVAAVRCILGDELEEVTVTGSVHRIHPEHDIEAATKAMVVYAGGQAMTYEECGYHQPPEPLPRGLHFVFEKGILGTGVDHVWTSDRDGNVTRHELVPEPAGGSYGAIYGEMLKAIRGEGHYPTARHGARDVQVALAAYASASRGKTIDLRDPEWAIC